MQIDATSSVLTRLEECSPHRLKRCACCQRRSMSRLGKTTGASISLFSNSPQCCFSSFRPAPFWRKRGHHPRQKPLAQLGAIKGLREIDLFITIRYFLLSWSASSGVILGDLSEPSRTTMAASAFSTCANDISTLASPLDLPSTEFTAVSQSTTQAVEIDRFLDDVSGRARNRSHYHHCSPKSALSRLDLPTLGRPQIHPGAIPQ